MEPNPWEIGSNPIDLLDLLTGAVQAYIFAALAMVFIGSALNESAPPKSKATA